ncbi:hypothetical protein LFML04_1768 [Leptospirillum ferriphilum ML-04]|uniref:Uncharacterized protein n=1 Tax=Leptospirillum ferriphilum (strain ML-04) TaxID=1048260 RepID=J9ZDN0_LEPFM|nr:hypothetical protein LFML04_1768 [Leptospirillum ferriphilum ML-04]
MKTFLISQLLILQTERLNIPDLFFNLFVVPDDYFNKINPIKTFLSYLHYLLPDKFAIKKIRLSSQ